MSIRDWEMVEKVQPKLEKGLVLSNICWNFEKNNIRGIFGKTSRKFLNHWENILKTWVNSEWICVNFTNTKNFKFCTCHSKNFRNIW